MSESVAKIANGRYFDDMTQRAPKTSLGKNEFLQILVAQLKYQDPLAPKDDTEFIAQLAQFNSLEQMMNIAQTSSLSQSYSLIGRYVTAVAIDGNGQSYAVEGFVRGVTTINGVTTVRVGNTDVLLTNIVDVYDADFVKELLAAGESVKDEEDDTTEPEPNPEGDLSDEVNDQNAVG